LPEPPGFRGTLRPYQRLGLGWLDRLAELGLGGCLADDMGLGKTVQVLALLLHRKARGQASGPTLLVCPTSVLGNWQAEASRFAPELRVLVWYGSARPRGEALAALARSADMVLTTYGLLARDGEALAALPWDGVILDEAQNIKNPAVQQARVARGLRARYRFALTGTPVENGLGDLWSIFAFALPGYLGSERSFRRHYARPVAHGDGAALARLRRVIAPFVLRRSKRDPGVADELPPKIEVRHDCPLTREQAALYEAVVRQSLEEIARAQGLRRRATILATLLRLKQICDHPALFTGDPGPLEGRSGKLRRLEELLADVLAEGDRALVFTQFATWARRLQAYLAARCPCPVWCLDGSVPGAQRTELVRRFQEGEGPAVFVLSLKAGGAGLNLTAAQHVFHYDRWWNPAVEEQATDRTYRIGQVRSVQVHKFLVPGTLEERIDALLAGKAAVARELLARDGGVEAWLAELDVDRLREVLALGPGWGEE
jgi:SNF2 family DNA or RNA helicase